jgi:hypothetical protein
LTVFGQHDSFSRFDEVLPFIMRTPEYPPQVKRDQIATVAALFAAAKAPARRRNE